MTADDLMTVSVVIPTIGRPTLERAVQSALQQWVPSGSVEIIVVNNSGQPLLAAPWHGDSRVRVIDSARCERCFARNLGAAIARGAWLCFLDDDDYLLPGGLAALAERAGRTDAGLVYGGTQLVHRDGTSAITLEHGWSGNVFVQAMAGEWIPLQSSLIRADSFFALAGSRQSIVGAEDVDLLASAAMDRLLHHSYILIQDGQSRRTARNVA